MKIIQNESYLAFINRKVMTFFTKTFNLIYTGIVLVGISVFWYEDGFLEMLKILIMLLNAFSIFFFLVELLSSVISKEIDKNNFISQLTAILILTIISFIFYDENFRYWSLALGIILFIPVTINILFEKIRMMLKL